MPGDAHGAEDPMSGEHEGVIRRLIEIEQVSRQDGHVPRQGQGGDPQIHRTDAHSCRAQHLEAFCVCLIEREKSEEGFRLIRVTRC